MSVSDDLRASVIGLMGDMGQPITIQRITPGAYDPSTGLTGAETTASYPGLGRLGTYADMVVDGTIIQQFDRKVTWVGSDQNFVPRINDRIVAGSDVYVVMNLKPREISGAWVSFTLQARRGGA